MNLLQRARASRSSSRFGMPAEFDMLSQLYRLNNRPMNGELEVADGNLDAIAEHVYKANGPVWALVAVRMLLFAEARFQFQRMRGGRPGELFNTSALRLLEHPFGPGSTLGDMLARAEQDVSLMGNAFITDRTIVSRSGDTVQSDKLRRLRPDWVTMVYGSQTEPEMFGDALDGELIAYLYTPRMPGGSFGAGTVLLPHEVAHYAPYPDPQAYHRGMSWITPVIREVGADEAALIHKSSFFRNGAGPRLAMKIDPSIEKDDFEKLAATIEAHHTGPWNAYKTLYLGGGADPVPMTFNMRDLDYHAVTGGGETRLASAAGVPPTIVGFSEGLAGSALNAGNYQQSKRRLGDATLRPLWRNFAGSLETLFPPPGDDCRLWYDDRDIAFLRDDTNDAATIAANNATTAKTLIDAGFDPATVVLAVQSGDMSQLKHTGLVSVQLQPPGAKDPADPGTPPAKATTTSTGTEGPATTPGDGTAA